VAPEFLHPWIAVGVTVAVFVLLQLRRGAAADFFFLAGLVAVTLAGVIDSRTALSGFANSSIVAIAALMGISAGLRHTGCLDWLGHRLLGGSKSEFGAMARLGAISIGVSAFLLNTAVVAMMAPIAIEWCRRHRISPSRILIPVSYFAIIGGVCTVIGTSTTLVVNGKLKAEYERRQAPGAVRATLDQPDSDEGIERGGRQSQQKSPAFIEALRPMGFLELGMVGLPCAVAGGLFLVFFGGRLLPNRTDLVEKLGEERREYLVEMLVRPECRLLGKSIEAAGLRHLPGLFLIEIDRAGEIITPVAPDDVIHAGDRLVFTGVVSTILDLQKIPGLVPAADRAYEIHPRRRSQRRITEAVLSRSSPVIGRTVRQARFRRRYSAAIVAVHRNGERLTNKIGDIELQAGDTLLLQTRDDFVATYRNSPDFYLVSSVEGADGRRHDRAIPAAIIVVAMVVWLMLTSVFGADRPFLGLTSPAIAALTGLLMMILWRCLTISAAREAIPLNVVFVIAGSLGLGAALDESGATAAVAEPLVRATGDNPYLLLIVVYLLAMLLTELVTNVAVAALLFPLVIAVAEAGGYSPRPFIIAISIAASLSFITPIGYQTNLMVMGPGGYRPLDYVKIGLPMALITATIALLLIPRIWAFAP